jgi:hypothetical protein
MPALPLSTTQLLIESPDIQQPDMAAAESQEIEMTAAKNKVAGNGPGVIATIVETISRAKGASIEELVAVLSKKFPNRGEDGMRATTRIQANRNCTSKEKDEKRGLVYFKRRGAAR